MVLHGKIRLDGLPTAVFNQQHLGNAILSLFPGKHIISNSRKGVGIPAPDSGFYLELDFWIPDLNLAFEYQDPHHYVTSWYSYRSVASVQKRDDHKSKIAKEKGVSLIVVPCWWDGKVESLVASIHQIRPDVLSNFDKKGKLPISGEIPKDFFVINQVPDVGEMMLASMVENHTFDPSGWWVSEKYDGIRACYHPIHKMMYSRFGRKLNIRESFVRQFPSAFVDGEIWFGRESHLDAQQLYVIAEEEGEQDEFDEDEKPEMELEGRNAIINDSVRWEFMKLVAIEFADPKLQALPYEERFATILSTMDVDLPTLTIVSPFSCRSRKMVRTSLQSALDGGGEGIVLRKPKSIYSTGRSDSLVKFKTHRDQEALVLDVESNNEVTLKLPDGTIFVSRITPDYKGTAISSDRIPNIGDIVTFKYSKLSAHGQPWQATVERVRRDLLWEDVLRSFNSKETRKRSADDCFEFTFGRKVTNGYWLENDGKNVKEFFDNLAAKKGADPSSPETWYKTTYREVYAANGMPILKHYGGSLRQALMTVYPNIGLEISKFPRAAHNYWMDISNRRKFFEDLAAQKGFDPRKVAHWFSVTPKSLLNLKGGAAVFAYYNGSIAAALRDIYPELGIDDSQFIGKTTENKWRVPENRRKFMDEFAAAREFDPLIPENWYNVTFRQITEAQGGTLLSFYSSSLTKLITSVYPDIGLDESRFSHMKKGYWSDKTIKRFFDDYARSKNFDPLIPGNWYSVSGRMLKRLKGGWSAVGNNTIATALTRAYPDIGINPGQFTKSIIRLFETRENRKDYFENFAKNRGADPTTEAFWYSIKVTDILADRDGRAVLAHYNDSLRRALVDLYPNVILSSYKFDRVDKNYWSTQSNQRRALDKIALKYGFESLVPEHWYTFPRSILWKEKGMGGIVTQNNGRLEESLIVNYPELDLRPELFQRHHNNLNYWKNKDNQRKLAIYFAKSRGFDPLIPSQWLPYMDIDARELRPITKLHGKSLLKALAELFPTNVNHMKITE